jgi:hypothetical protein
MGEKEIIYFRTVSTEANRRRVSKYGDSIRVSPEVCVPSPDVPAKKAMKVAAVMGLVLIICSAFLM